jgi:adenylosuccinate lyase
MIARYSRPRMSAIWAPETRFRIWFEIEAHALDAMAELGIVPKEAAAAVWERGAFEVERIDAIEAEVRHDVLPSGAAEPRLRHPDRGSGRAARGAEAPRS